MPVGGINISPTIEINSKAATIPSGNILCTKAEEENGRERWEKEEEWAMA